ncbi:MAG: sigma-E factor negative regulatory protein [Rhodanobacteraceae bacterium]|jgi:sigma-E factor negative regulatory protein RseA|nr:sigma-E factor negative regulatory protein [Rhodanobacteraceae bacterium]
MNEQIHEHLSALMDGELERDQTRFLLRRLATDQELPLRWARYHVVRETLRRQDTVVLAPDFAAAVSARLQHEAIAPAHGAGRWLRWGTGGAIAASVAVAALMLTRPADDGLSEPGARMARSTQPSQAVAIQATPAAATTARDIRPPLLVPTTPVEAAPASFGAELGQPATLDPRLQTYLIRHYQAVGGAGQSGLVPYVLLGVPQREATFTQPVEPAPQNH